MLNKYRIILAILFINLFISCSSDESTSPEVEKEYITYNIDAMSVYSVGTNGELRNQISKSVDSLIPTGLELYNVEKPMTAAGEMEADNNQIQIFNERFNVLDNVWKFDHYTNDTTMHFYLERNIRLKRSNQAVYLAEYKYARFMPLVINTKWVYEKENNQYLQFFDDSTCNLQFNGNNYVLIYERLDHINIKMPDNSSLKFGFISGKRGFIIDPETNEKHYFVKQ